MSTLIHFLCRNPLHLGTPAKGTGSIVVRHGTAAYCDSPDASDRHQWVATGGVPLDALLGGAAQMGLWEDPDDDVHARARNIQDELGRAHPSALVP